MSLSADIYEHTKQKLEQAVAALEAVPADAVVGIADARSSLKSARATLRLIEKGQAEWCELNDRLGAVVGMLGPIRDMHVVRPSPPPMDKSVLKVVDQAQQEAMAAIADLENLGKPQVSIEEVIAASGASYRQARRRFLRALPEDEDTAFDSEALHQCRKATQRVFLQLDCLLAGQHTKRSARFGQLSDLLGQHRDLVVLSAASDQSQWQLEAAITQVGLVTYERKPSAYREWLASKL